MFPFVDTALLERARAARVAPKLFLTNGSYEYWGRVASLVHSRPMARATRRSRPTRASISSRSGTRAALAADREKWARYDIPGLDQRPVQRALLAALQAWAADGVAPPPSRYPKLSAGELTTPDRLKFPVADVAVPRHARRARKLDFGPEFATKGVITKEPPDENGAYPLLVPQVDADGIDLGGIRLPELAVPLATVTGWNLRAPERGASEEMVEFLGSFWPFPKTREDRARTHDARLSIAERYATRDAYMKRVDAAAADLVKQRFLLPAGSRVGGGQSGETLGRAAIGGRSRRA